MRARVTTFSTYGFIAILSFVSAAGSANAQTFLPQGPAPDSGPRGIVQSADGPGGRTGTVTGLVQAIAPSPTDPNTVYIGGGSGGIWVTHDGGASWTPLADRQTSLSISTLAFDPTDNAHQKLIAGTGFTGNGLYDSGLGGKATGLLYTTNGGSSWTTLGASVFSGKSITGAAVRGDTILATVGTPHDISAPGGLYMSTNAGSNWTLVSGTGNLPTGAIAALASDPANQKAFYVAVNGVGIYASTDGGTVWQRLSNAPAIADGQSARLATGPNGSVVAGVYSQRNGETGGELTALYLSKDNGSTWTALSVPTVNSGHQANTNLAVAIDPNNPNIVYVSGDRQSVATTIAAYRVVLNPDRSSTVTSLTDEGAANSGTVHADSRALAFDAAGRLLLGSDGGVYARTDPSTTTGTWTGLNGQSLALKVVYNIAYDSRSGRLAVAAQDTGVAFQNGAGAAGYTPVAGGDGLNAVINSTSYSNDSVFYTSSQGLRGLARHRIDNSGNLFGTQQVYANLNLQPDDFSGTDDGEGILPFYSRIVLNKKNPALIALGTNYVYLTDDAKLRDSVSDPLSLVGKAVGAIDGFSSVTALAYGTADNVNAIIAGSKYRACGSCTDIYNIFFSTTGAANSLIPVGTYTGGYVYSVAFDYRSYERYFVADGSTVWGTRNGGGAFPTYSSYANNLAALNIVNPVALEFISSNGVNALLVGGLVGAANGPSPIAVADSDGAGVLGNWRAFGNGIPNVLISALSYDSAADVLAVGTWGRGAWLLYDVTSNFSSATRLQFGLANNDSRPDASLLTNGDHASRDLVKSGSGTLTIGGAASYTGTTTVSAGTVVVNGSIASSSLLTVASGATLAGGGTVPSTILTGTLAPSLASAAPTTLSVAGGYAGGSQSTFRLLATPTQSDRLNVSGVAALAGQVVVTPVAGQYAARNTYTIVSANGGRSGGFSGVTSAGTLPFLQPSLSYDANNAYLTLTAGGFSAAVQGGNRGAVANVLDRSAPSASGDFSFVIGALSQMSAGQAPGVFDQLSGQQYTGFGTVFVQSAQVFMTNFAQQAGGSRIAGGRIALAEACETACDTSPGRKWSAWGGALAGLGTVAGDANSNGLTYNIGGFAAGLDNQFDPMFRGGIALGYTTSTQYMQGMTGQGSAGNAQVALYGAFGAGALYADALAGYARGSLQMQRQINVPGLNGRTAYGQAATDQFFGQLEAGYRIDLGGTSEGFLAPFARLQASTATQAPFSESGANSLNLNVAAQTTNSLRSVFGGQLGGKIDAGFRDPLALVLRLGWSHEFADTARPMTASFAGAPVSPFSVAGAQAPRDGAILGLAATTAIADATSLYLRYDGELQGGNTSHVFSAGVRMTW